VKLAEKSLPFFSVLWGPAKVKWGESNRRLSMI
jgi:hypothetical protein